MKSKGLYRAFDYRQVSKYIYNQIKHRGDVNE
jgi:hypothetical protein